MNRPPSFAGRGAAENPPNRFEATYFEPDEAAWWAEPSGGLGTTCLPDHAGSILSANDSPDLPFRFSLNPYRGCEHGCAYCYARPGQESLGYSAGLDFERRILYKPAAGRLLAEALARASWQPQVIALSGVTDPYQPVERERQLTRRCLEVLAAFRNPVSLITKNAGILRDLPLLETFAAWNGVQVAVSITTLDTALARALEPRTASPRQRLEVVRVLAAAGIPVTVMMAPVIPGLTDVEIPALIEAAAQAGACDFQYLLLRLPGAVEGLFLAWLDRHVPTRKARIIDRLRSMRGGRLNQSAFGMRFTGEGPGRENLQRLARLGRRRAGFSPRPAVLNTRAFRPPGGRQLELELFAAGDTAPAT